jgi:hypothetical protein
MYGTTKWNIVTIVSPRGQSPWQSYDFDASYKG